MASGKVVGILVLIVLIALALVYTFSFNHQLGIIKSRSSQTTTPSGNNSGTKIVAYNNTNSSSTHSSNSITQPSNGIATTTAQTTTVIRQVYSIPITLRNGADGPTQAGMQTMIIVPSSNYSPYINKNWNNVEFTTGPEGSGSTIEAWVESNATSAAKTTVVWLKLPAVIGENNAMVIYMNFMNFQVMSRLGPTGEAPQLSPIYAEYDNGARVFNFYDNFSGRELNTKLWSNASAFASNPIEVDDGLTIGQSLSKQNNGYSAVLSLDTFGQGVVDFYGTLLDNSTLPHYQDVGLVPASSNNACNLIAIGSFNSPKYNGLQTISSYCNSKYIRGLKFGSPMIYSIYVPSLSPTNVTATVNYADPITSSFTSIILPQTIGFENQGSGGNLGPIYWIRQRDYPPGGVLPTWSFGKLQ